MFIHFIFVLVSLGFANAVGEPTITDAKNASSSAISLTIQLTGCPCSYTLQYNIQNNSEITNKTFGIFGNQTDQLVTGLKSKTEYEFRVAAISSQGKTGWSATYNVRTAKDTTELAEILGSKDVSSNQLTLEIRVDGCPCQYTLQYNIQGSSEITSKTFGNFFDYTYPMVTGLQSNTQYEFRVLSYSIKTKAHGLTRIYTVLTSKDTITGPVQITGSTIVSPHQLSLKIQLDGCPCSYTLRYNIRGSSQITSNTFGIFHNQIESMVTGLQSNTEYEFRVVLISNTKGQSGISPKYALRTPKNNITGIAEILQSINILPNQVSLEIQFDGCPCSYMLQYTIKNTSVTTNKLFGTHGNYAVNVVTGLQSNTDYDIRVLVISSTKGQMGTSPIYKVKTAMGSNGNILAPSLFTVLVAMLLKMFFYF